MFAIWLLLSWNPLMTKSSLGVVFRGCHVLWRSFTFPVWFTRCLNRTMARMAYIELFSRLSVWHTSNYHSSRMPSFYIWQFSTCHVEIKLRKYKVLPVLHVHIPIWKPRQTWVMQRYRWTYKTLFRRSLINRPIQNYRYHERILYVIQLSDVTFLV